MDEEIKKLLKFVEELGYKLKNEPLKKKERKKLEREWKLKDQELNNYIRKLEFKMRSVGSEGKTEERNKLFEEWKTIIKISYDSHPRIIQTWNPLRIQRIIEEVYKKAQEKELDKTDVKKERSMIKMQKDETKMKWHFRFKELVSINPDPKAVRTMLLTFKDFDEEKIDNGRLKELLKEFVQSAKKNCMPSPQEFVKKYPIFDRESNGF